MALLITLLVFSVTLIQAPLQSAGWLWDAANALGFLGFAGFIYLYLEVGAGHRSRIHQLISYATVGLILAHALVLLIADATLWHYLIPSAPDYMLAGIAALLGLACIITLALPSTRRAWHPSHQNFQRWHYWLSLFVIGTAFWHIAGSGFYISRTETVIYLGLISLVVIAHASNRMPRPAKQRSLFLAPILAVGFVLLKGLG